MGNAPLGHWFSATFVVGNLRDICHRLFGYEAFIYNKQHACIHYPDVYNNCAHVHPNIITRIPTCIQPNTLVWKNNLPKQVKIILIVTGAKLGGGRSRNKSRIQCQMPARRKIIL